MLSLKEIIGLYILSKFKKLQNSISLSDKTVQMIVFFTDFFIYKSEIFANF